VEIKFPTLQSEIFGEGKIIPTELKENITAFAPVAPEFCNNHPREDKTKTTYE
jgi:hypothetical protein